MNKRVVITGVGPVSAIGIGRAAFFDGLRTGCGGIGPAAAAPAGGAGPACVAAVRGFDVRDYLETEKAYLDRASQLAFAAMSLAIEDANLDLTSIDRSRAGLVFGSAFGCLESAQLFYGDFLAKGPRFVKPIVFPHTYANTTISLLAIEYGLSGYHLAFASGVTSSAAAILQAGDAIRAGRCALAFAGGAEALSPLLLYGYDSGGAVLGEGAGILVLEDEEHARRRGARILGAVAGGGAAGGAAARAMRAAVRDADGALFVPDAISAAANGNRALDRMEAEAIAAFLGDRAGAVPVCRVKPLIGEVLGADGALRAIAALGAMRTGFLPPAPSVTGDDSAGLNVVRGAGLAGAFRRMLVNSIDPGGSAVCLALEGGEG